MMLDMYVVYDHPTDFPNHFVVRHWIIGAGRAKPTDRCVIGKTLDEVRTAIPAYCVRLERSPEDEPQVLESWV
jgi:hypothetical protein